MVNKLEPIGKSSTGMDENVAALLAVLIFPITSIIFFLIEKESKFVKFHALQTGILGVALFVLNIVLGLIPILGWLVMFILGIGSFVIWVMLLFKTYQGEWFEIPLIGKIAHDQLNKQV